MIFHHFLSVSASYMLLLLKLELSFYIVLQVIFSLLVKGPEAFVHAGSCHPRALWSSMVDHLQVESRFDGNGEDCWKTFLTQNKGHQLKHIYALSRIKSLIIYFSSVSMYEMI